MTIHRKGEKDAKKKMTSYLKNGTRPSFRTGNVRNPEARTAHPCLLDSGQSMAGMTIFGIFEMASSFYRGEPLRSLRLCGEE